jgi:uncharacterized membrane protein
MVPPTAPPPALPPPARPGHAAWGLLPALVALAFLALALPPYLTLDPAGSRVPVPAAPPAFYPLLLAHVGFGSVALLGACLQVWPGLRARRPRWHRAAGRVYVFCGVLPAASSGFAIGVMTPFGPVARASNLLLATLWLTCTWIGWRRGRSGRFVEHRRWMLRSVALTFSILTNRVWATLGFVWLGPALETTFHGDERLLTWTLAGLSTWLGWTLPLLAVEAWLERDAAGRASR